MVTYGLTMLFLWQHDATSAGICIGVMIYLVGLAALTITCRRSRPFFALCAVHLFQAAVAVVSFAQLAWHSVRRYLPQPNHALQRASIGDRATLDLFVLPRCCLSLSLVSLGIHSRPFADYP